MNILVFDVGTSSIRGVLFNNFGIPAFIHSIAYQVEFFNRVYAEQNPLDWSSSIVQISRKAVEYCSQHGCKIDALSITSQRSSFIPLNIQGEPLRPAIMWQDKRNNEIISEMRSQFECIPSLSGIRINTVFSGTKLMWFRKNEPELYANTFKICTIADFIVHEITGEFRTDYTYGSSLLMNIQNYKWDNDLLDLFDIDEDKLCELLPPGSIVGTVSNEFSLKTGLLKGIPVISGGGDQQCSALGQGVICKGRLAVTTGSGAFLMGFSDSIPDNVSCGLVCAAHSIPGKYVLEGSMLTCTVLYNWAKRELFGTDVSGFDNINNEVKQSPVGANGCIAFPFFQGRGTPDWNGSAKGALLNLNLKTTRGDISRAILEGIAIEIKNNIDIMERYSGKFDRIHVSGGLTQFSVFNQIQADVYQKVVYRSILSEQTAFGAWIVAAIALGILDNYESAFTNSLGKHECYLPEPSNKDIYKRIQDEINSSYRSLYGKGQL